MQNERTWGVTPVPDRLRSLSLGDLTLLWGTSASACSSWSRVRTSRAWASSGGLLAIVVGASSAALSLASPAISEPTAASRGWCSCGSRSGTGALTHRLCSTSCRTSGGRPSSSSSSQPAANALADRVFGFRERWVWVLGLRRDHACPGARGPDCLRPQVRPAVRRLGVAASVATSRGGRWTALTGDLWNADATGGITFWQGVDLTVAAGRVVASLAADYTRFARRPRHAFWEQRLATSSRSSGCTDSARFSSSRAGRRHDRPPHLRRGRWDRQRARARRPHRRRDGRALRQRLLGGGLGAEPRTRGPSAPPRPRESAASRSAVR